MPQAQRGRHSQDLLALQDLLAQRDPPALQARLKLDTPALQGRRGQQGRPAQLDQHNLGPQVRQVQQEQPDLQVLLAQPGQLKRDQPGQLELQAPRELQGSLVQLGQPERLVQGRPGRLS